LADKEDQLRTLFKRGGSSLDGLIDALQLEQLDAVPDDIALLNMCGAQHA